MKKNNLLKVLLITLAVIVICTWLIPITTFNGELVKGNINSVNISFLMQYPLEIIRYFGYLIIYMLSIGALYGVLNKIPAYKSLIENIAKSFKGLEFLIIVSILLAILGSVTGLSLGFLIIFPLLISIILELGYNKLVAVTTTVGSVIVGLIGTTFGYASVSQIVDLLEVDVFHNIFIKIIIFVLTLAVLIVNLCFYANRTKNGEEKKSAKNSKLTKTEKGKKVSIIPLVIIFDLMFLTVLLSSTSWVSVFKIDVFTKATEWFNNFKVFKYPLFTNVIGSLNPFGEWTLYNEIPTLVFVTTAILAIVYRVKFDDFIEGVGDGFKKAVKPIFLGLFIYLFLIIATYHPFQLTIYKFVLGITKNVNVITITIITFLSSLLNVESLYTAQSVIPYLSSITTNKSLLSILDVLIQSIYGLAMLILPSSVLLITTLCYTDVSYGQWMKHIWKIFLEMLVVILIVVLVAVIIF